jgi:hypothetical protein
MPITTIDELKEQIAILPTQLREALNKQIRAQLEVNKFQEQVERLKATLKEQSDEEEPEESEDENVELIKLESKLDRLKIKLSEAEDRAELDFRRETPKATESHVKAAVGNNTEVNRLRVEIIDAKEEARIKKITLQRERRAAWDARMQGRRTDRIKSELESKELDALQGQLSEALFESMMADAEVETLQAQLDVYKMLVQLEAI